MLVVCKIVVKFVETLKPINMITYGEFKSALAIVNEYKLQVDSHLKSITKDIGCTEISESCINDVTIGHSGCSVRLQNAIKHYGIDNDLDIDYRSRCIELSKVSLTEFAKTRGVGRKTLLELKELCIYNGVYLKP